MTSCGGEIESETGLPKLSHTAHSPLNRSAARMAQRAAVFSSYRRLYRARIALFRGDEEAMRESRRAVRAQYLQHGTAELTDATHWQSLLAMAEEAADMLRHSIVRGNLNPQTGHYGTCACLCEWLVVICCFCLNSCCSHRQRGEAPGGPHAFEYGSVVGTATTAGRARDAGSGVPDGTNAPRRRRCPGRDHPRGHAVLRPNHPLAQSDASLFILSPYIVYLFRSHRDRDF
jgi:hypothetical protein